MFETQFTNLDWGIVVVYLVGTGVFGIYVHKHVHNASDYLVDGRGPGQNKPNNKDIDIHYRLDCCSESTYTYLYYQR